MLCCSMRTEGVSRGKGRAVCCGAKEGCRHCRWRTELTRTNGPTSEDRGTAAEGEEEEEEEEEEAEEEEADMHSALTDSDALTGGAPFCSSSNKSDGAEEEDD